MTPYEKVESLLSRYSIADVLLMISDIANERAYIARVQKDKWSRAGLVLRLAVKKLPKVSGIK